MTPACRSKPSHHAWSGCEDSTHGASGSVPRRSTRAPARGPSATRPCTAALASPASASDSAASGSVASASSPIPRRASSADEHAEHGAAQRVVERQAVAQPVRHGEDPLAHGDERQHGVDQVRGLLRHAPPAATGADGARFTRKRDQALERAVGASHATEAAPEVATAEEVPELALDEARHARAVGGGGRLVEEALQVRLHHVAESHPRRRPWLVDSRQQCRGTANDVPPIGGSHGDGLAGGVRTHGSDHGGSPGHGAHQRALDRTVARWFHSTPRRSEQAEPR